MNHDPRLRRHRKRRSTGPLRSSRRSPGSRTRRNARVPDHPLSGSHLHGLRPQKQLRSQRHLRCHGLRQTHKNHSPATPPGHPLRRPRKTGPRHRLQIRPRLPKPLRTPTIPPHRNPGRTLLRTLRNGLRKKTKRIPNKNQIPVLIKKSGRNTFLPGFFISISQYTAQKKAAPSKRDCPFHHLIPITSICARIASTHFSNPSFPEFRHRS